MKKTIQQLLYGDGEGNLSDHELLTTLLSSTGVAEQLLSTYGSLRSIQVASTEELQKVPGLGLSRIARLRASTLLQERTLAEKVCRGRRFLTPEDVFAAIGPLLAKEEREVFLLLPLDAKYRLLSSPVTVSIGSKVATVVHPREVLQALIKAGAVAAIVCHNHPSSGDPEPSHEDIDLTLRLKQACDLVQITLLDHVIVGEDWFCSLTERGLI